MKYNIINYPNGIRLLDYRVNATASILPDSYDDFNKISPFILGSSKQLPIITNSDNKEFILITEKKDNIDVFINSDIVDEFIDGLSNYMQIAVYYIDRDYGNIRRQQFREQYSDTVLRYVVLPINKINNYLFKSIINKPNIKFTIYDTLEEANKYIYWNGSFLGLPQPVYTKPDGKIIV